MLGQFDFPFRERLAVRTERLVVGLWCHGFLQDLFDQVCFAGGADPFQAKRFSDLYEVFFAFFFELCSTELRSGHVSFFRGCTNVRRPSTMLRVRNDACASDSRLRRACSASPSTHILPRRDGSRNEPLDGG